MFVKNWLYHIYFILRDGSKVKYRSFQPCALTPVYLKKQLDEACIISTISNLWCWKCTSVPKKLYLSFEGAHLVIETCGVDVYGQWLNVLE